MIFILLLVVAPGCSPSGWLLSKNEPMVENIAENQAALCVREIEKSAENPKTDEEMDRLVEKLEKCDELQDGSKLPDRKQ